MWRSLVDRFEKVYKSSRFSDCIMDPLYPKKSEYRTLEIWYKISEPCMTLGKLVLERLMLLAFTGLEVPLGEPVLQRSISPDSPLSREFDKCAYQKGQWFT